MRPTKAVACGLNAPWQLEGWLHVEVQVMNCTWCTLVMACICKHKRITTCCSTRRTAKARWGTRQRAAVMIPPQGGQPACLPADLTHGRPQACHPQLRDTDGPDEPIMRVAAGCSGSAQHDSYCTICLHQLNQPLAVGIPMMSISVLA